MRRFKRTRDRKSTERQYRPRLVELETRLCLACDLQLVGDGTLQILGDDLPQIVDIQDLGNGNVSVRCQDRGASRAVSRLFSGVTAVVFDLKGGDDRLHYSSVQDVNAALPFVRGSFGAGNDKGDLEVVLSGTPDRPRGFAFVVYGDSGDDLLRTSVTTLTSARTPTEPVMRGEIHGGAGRDELTFNSSTATGGFQLTSEELNPSAEGTTSQPGCLIWDLVDGTSGEVNAHVMGSDADESIVLRCDARGIGRSQFGLVLDGRGGFNSVQVVLIVGDWSHGEHEGRLAIRNAAKKRLEVGGVVDLVATSSSQRTQAWDDGWWQLELVDHARTTAATLDIVGTDGPDDVDVQVGGNFLSSLVMNLDTRGGNDVAKLKGGDRDAPASNKLFVGGLSWNTSDIEALEVSVDTGELTFHFDGSQANASRPGRNAARSSPANARIDVGESGKLVQFIAASYDDVDLDLDLKGHDTRVQIGLLLPAVQKIEYAAARMNLRSSGAGNAIAVSAESYPAFDGAFDLSGPATRLEVGLIIPIVNGKPVIFPPAQASIDVRSSGAGNAIAVSAEGYPGFDFKLTAAPAPMKVVTIEYLVLGTFLALDASNFKGGIDMHASQRQEGTSLRFENVELKGALKLRVEGANDFSRRISGMHINDGGSYQETIRIADERLGTSRGFGFVTMSGGAVQIAKSGKFSSLIIGGRKSDHVESHLEDVVNLGEFVQTVQTGDGADTVWQTLNGFENYGTATFDTRLGEGDDSYLALARGEYVAPGGSLLMHVDGEAGRDVILANIRATVDGNYRFVARGGGDDDSIGVIHEIRTSRRQRGDLRRSDRRPAIDILLEGNGGNDRLGLWMFAPEVDDELVHALIDGGKGWDSACTRGPVRVVNVEQECRGRDKDLMEVAEGLEFPNLVFQLPDD